MDEVNLLIESANKRVKASQPDSRSSTQGKKMDIEDFMKENNI